LCVVSHISERYDGVTARPRAWIRSVPDEPASVADLLGDGVFAFRRTGHALRRPRPCGSLRLAGKGQWVSVFNVLEWKDE
jgi:hypothetical protein